MITTFLYSPTDFITLNLYDQEFHPPIIKIIIVSNKILVYMVTLPVIISTFTMGIFNLYFLRHLNLAEEKDISLRTTAIDKTY